MMMTVTIQIQATIRTLMIDEGTGQYGNILEAKEEVR